MRYLIRYHTKGSLRIIPKVSHKKDRVGLVRDIKMVQRMLQFVPVSDQTHTRILSVGGRLAVSVPDSCVLFDNRFNFVPEYENDPQTRSYWHINPNDQIRYLSHHLFVHVSFPTHPREFLDVYMGLFRHPSG